jgi:hypothetical protein
MTGEQIVSKVCETYDMLDCRKFQGHVAVEIMKEALAAEGIETSARDVFIAGPPVEWDLLVPREGAEPMFNGLLYDPAQVKVAVEIKLSGIVGSRVKTLGGLHRSSELAQSVGVKYAYIGLCDRRNQAATTEKQGWSAFNLTWSLGNNRREESGDWPRAVEFLRRA